MCYDPERQRVVLFGGGSFYDDTWEWDGLAWTQAAPAIAPPARSYAAMAFDPNLGEVLMYGGGNNSLPPLIDTWSWDGLAWTWHQVGNVPPARAGHAMVSDVARRRVVLWGGLSWDAHVWEWDGTGWTAAFLLPPSPRPSPGMAYDAVNSRVVMFGGNGYADTWTYATDDPATFGV